MSFNFGIFLAILFQLLAQCKILIFAQKAPVLLLGIKLPAHSALQSMESYEFEKLMVPLMHQYMFVAYMEDELSAKDFICRVKKNGSSINCLRHLSQTTPRSYYTKVITPLDIFPEIEWHTTADLESALAPSTCQIGVVHAYAFGNATAYETRSELLMAHDDTIFRMSQHFPHDCPILQLYTANVHLPQTAVTGSLIELARKWRDDKKEEAPAEMIGDKYFSFKCQKITYKTYLPATKNTNIKFSKVESFQEISKTCQFRVVLHGDEKMYLRLGTRRGNYFVTDISYDGNDYKPRDIWAPLYFSYKCGIVFMTTPKSTLTFENLQLELFCNPKRPPKSITISILNTTTAKSLVDDEDNINKVAEENSIETETEKELEADHNRVKNEEDAPKDLEKIKSNDSEADSNPDKADDIIPTPDSKTSLSRHKRYKSPNRWHRKKTQNTFVYRGRHVLKQLENRTKSEFNEPWACDGTFSIVTLEAFMVCAILISILIMAILCIMDIGSNSRLDDPNGYDLYIGPGE